MTTAVPLAASVAALDDDALVAALRDALPGATLAARRMLGDVAAADDAVQEAMFRAWKSRARLEDRAAIHGWLRRIVVRECLRHLRWRAVKRFVGFGGAISTDEPEGVALPEPGLSAEDATERAQRIARVHALVDRLPPRQRAIWGLRFDEGWTLPQIAEALDVSVETVKTHLGRAVERVKRGMNDHV